MDPFYKQVFKEISEEEQIDRERVERVIRHLHDWTREQLQNTSVLRILWNKCFSFKRIDYKVAGYLDYCEKKLAENPNSVKWTEEVRSIKLLMKELKQ